jgi:hypothetical protein
LWHTIVIDAFLETVTVALAGAEGIIGPHSVVVSTSGKCFISCREILG